jgi:long-chain fatty acid transport protein
VFAKPAGMTCLRESRIDVGGYLILPAAKLRDEGTTFATGRPISGGDGGDAGEPLFVPNLYYVHSLNEALRLGLGITTPFGLKTEYRSTWVGRYHAIKSELRTVDINPAIAYRVHDSLALGGGVSLQYADAEVTNALDLGGLGTGLAAPGTDDGFVQVKGDEIGYGFNCGLLVEPSVNTRVGLHYWSKVEQRLEGTASFTNSVSALAKGTAAALRLVGQDAKADVTLPETLSISVSHRLGALLSRMPPGRGGVAWMNCASSSKKGRPMPSRFSIGTAPGASPWVRRMSRVSAGAFAPESFTTSPRCRTRTAARLVSRTRAESGWRSA